MNKDEKLEAALDSVGRDRAFALVRAHGWNSAPPKFIWWLAVQTLRAKDQANDR